MNQVMSCLQIIPTATMYIILKDAMIWNTTSFLYKESSNSKINKRDGSLIKTKAFNLKQMIIKKCCTICICRNKKYNHSII